jgi:hypothetical protein
VFGQRADELLSDAAEAGGLTEPTPGCAYADGLPHGMKVHLLNDLAPLTGGAFFCEMPDWRAASKAEAQPAKIIRIWCDIRHVDRMGRRRIMIVRAQPAPTLAPPARRGFFFGLNVASATTRVRIWR